MAYIGASPTAVPLTGADIEDGTVQIADLAATGTKDATTFLRGDGTFAEAGGGITQLDQWRLTTSITGNHNPISSNLERADTPTTALIGTGMTESSGIFTFPETGIYEIKATFLFYAAASTDGNCYGYIAATTDNSTYTDRAEIITHFAANDMGVSAHGSFLFDVTNTSTHKVRFETTLANGSDQIQGNTDRNLTHFTFTRLGDT